MLDAVASNIWQALPADALEEAPGAALHGPLHRLGDHTRHPPQHALAQGSFRTSTWTEIGA